MLSGDLKREFQKDLELFKHFLLLLNDTSPIRNVELMWHEEREELDPSKIRFKNRVGTGDALIQLQATGSPEGNRLSPSTLFCDLVHGFGAHEEETCARSDVPAKQRCRATGCTQVYSCHVGLTDIAAPVICDGVYLGTLFSGQVLVSPPTPQGFKFVREALNGQKHINFTSLEDAYYRVPVVTQAQVGETVRILELFARYIANSWKRLQLISESQRKQDRELSLDRKELASILLSGEIEDFQELKQLARRAGLQRIPDRVLVLQIEHLDSQDQQPKLPAPTLNRISHVVEDVCQGLPNSLATVVRPGEVCVFASQEVRNRSHQRLTLHDMAEGILAKIRSHSPVSVRIGIIEDILNPRSCCMHIRKRALRSIPADLRYRSSADPSHKAQVPDVMTRLLKAFRQGGRVSSTCRSLTLAMPSSHSLADMTVEGLVHLGHRAHFIGSHEFGNRCGPDQGRERSRDYGRIARS